MQVRSISGYIPPQVDPGHLHSNGRLLSDADIADVKTQYPSDPHHPRKIRKIVRGYQRQRLPFAVIIQDGQYYAVYSGQEGCYLGKGGFGKVKLAQNLDTGEWMALKVQVGNVSEMQKEVDLHSALRGASQSGFFTHTSTKKSRVQLYLLMKYVPGVSLDKLVRSRLGLQLSQSEYHLIILTLINAVQFLHVNKIIHRDIKPQNIIVNLTDLSVELVDFGLSAKVGGDITLFSSRAVGTRALAAPEIILKREYSEKSEVYALGVTLALLLGYGRFVQGAHRHERWFCFYDEVAADVDVVFGLLLDDSVNDFLKRMTDSDANGRPSLLEVKQFFGKVLHALPSREKKVKVGVVDVASIRKAAQQSSAALLGLVRELKDYCRIQLVDESGRADDILLAKCRAVLEREGLIVQDNVYVGASVGLVAKKLTLGECEDSNKQQYLDCEYRPIGLPFGGALAWSINMRCERLGGRQTPTGGAAAAAAVGCAQQGEYTSASVCRQ